LIKLTASEANELQTAARDAARRCRENAKRLRFESTEAEEQFRNQMEDIAQMWDRLAAAATAETSSSEHTGALGEQ
jgi:hypothetical protein